MKRDYGVSAARIAALFMILICHLGTHYGSGIVAELFVIGVEVFFFISGYLSFGPDKRYDIRWFLKRLVRLFVPVAVFSLIIIVTAKLTGADISGLQHCVLGYYGLSKILPGISFKGMDGFQHLWFITVIILCYAGLPLVKKLSEKLNSALKTLGVLLAIDIIFSVFSIRLSYFVVFYAGWLIKGCDWNMDSLKKTLSVNAALIISFGLRIICRQVFDNTWLYLQLVIPLTNAIEAFCIFCDIHALIKSLNFGKKDSGLRVLAEKTEDVSYEVYLVHYVFIEGFLNVFTLPLPEGLRIIAYFAVSFLAAGAVHLISKPINRFLKQHLSL